MRPDMIDPRTIRWQGTDVGGWPATVELNGITFKPGDGVFPDYDTAEANRRWPDITPAGWDGPIQFTLHAIVNVGGQWHGGGYILFWRGRTNTGANWLELAPDRTDGLDNWRANWADTRFGPSHGYIPKAGDEVGFCLSAGGNRMREATSVQERTPIVRLPLALNGSWVRPSAPEGPVVVEPPVVTHPPQMPPYVPGVDAILAQILDLRTSHEQIRGLLKELERMLEHPPIYDAPYLGALRPRRGPSGVDRG